MFIGSISYNAKLCNVTWNVDGWTTFPKTNKKECIVIYLFHCISTYLQEMNRKRERYIWVWEGIVWESQRFITLLRDHIDIITSGHEWILPCIQSRIVQAAKYCICAWSHTDLAEAAPPRPQRVSGLAVEGDGLAHGVAAAAAAAGGAAGSTSLVLWDVDFAPRKVKVIETERLQEQGLFWLAGWEEPIETRASIHSNLVEGHTGR